MYHDTLYRYESGGIETTTQSRTTSTYASAPVYSSLSATKGTSFREKQGAYGMPLALANKLGVLQPFTSYRRIEFSIALEAGSFYMRRQPINADPASWEQDTISNYGSIPLLDQGYSRSGPAWAVYNSYNYDYILQKAASVAYTQGMDALTFLAEIGKTRSMITGVAQRLLKLKRNIPRNIKRLARNRDWTLYYEALNLWLEGRYGWRTFMYDIEDLQKSYHNLNKQFVRSYGKYGDSLPIFDASSSSAGFYDGRGLRTTGVTHSGNVRFSAHVVADFKSANFRGNPVVTAWELVPYSFVVDWLLNIGTALEASSLLLLASDVKASCGALIDHNYFVNVSVSSADAASTFSGGYSYSAKAVTKIREPTSVISTIPQVRLRLDKFKVLDLISLATIPTRGVTK